MKLANYWRANPDVQWGMAIEVMALIAAAILLVGTYNMFTRADLFRTHYDRYNKCARSRCIRVEPVMTLPDDVAFQNAAGIHYDLAYKFDVISGGEWVGLLQTADRRQSPAMDRADIVTLETDEISKAMTGAGLNHMPPIPLRTGWIIVNDMFTAFFVFVIGYGVVLIMRKTFLI